MNRIEYRREMLLVARECMERARLRYREALAAVIFWSVDAALAVGIAAGLQVMAWLREDLWLGLVSWVPFAVAARHCAGQARAAAHAGQARVDGLLRIREETLEDMRAFLELRENFPADRDEPEPACCAADASDDGAEFEEGDAEAWKGEAGLEGEPNL